MARSVEQDVETIGRIEAVPTILDVVCRTTGMGFAAVARVTEDRWVACSVKDDIAFGLKPGGELKIETTICSEIREHGDLVIIDHVAADEAYCRHPTPAMYGFQSYISMPIVLPDRTFFGTLCAVDPRPARLNTPEVVGMFRLFAQLIAFHIDAIERLTSVEASLKQERETAELREQFVAVLGHDLRAPLAAIDAGVRILQRESMGEKSSRVTGLMQNSVRRMAGLIENILDFARIRLGGGFALTQSDHDSLEPMLDLVAAELRTAVSGRLIETHIDLSSPVACDHSRIGQLASNLLGNALAYGAADRPVRLEAVTKDGAFELSVVNYGDPIPPRVMDRLFQPFFRGETRSNQQGLGLGLHIASEIARAHGGTLSVQSSSEETRFTFRMPLG